MINSCKRLVVFATILFMIVAETSSKKKKPSRRAKMMRRYRYKVNKLSEMFEKLEAKLNSTITTSKQEKESSKEDRERLDQTLVDFQNRYEQKVDDLTSDVNRTQVQLNLTIDSSTEERQRLNQNQELIDVTIANLTATGEIMEKKLANLTLTIDSSKEDRERLDQTIANLTLNNDDEYLKLTHELEKLTTTINNNTICTGKSSAWLGGGVYVYLDIKMDHCNFKNRPHIVTALSGNTNHMQAKGMTSLYSPSNTFFRVYVTSKDSKWYGYKDTSASEAKSYGWELMWMAIEN